MKGLKNDRNVPPDLILLNLGQFSVSLFNDFLSSSERITITEYEVLELDPGEVNLIGFAESESIFNIVRRSYFAA